MFSLVTGPTRPGPDQRWLGDLLPEPSERLLGATANDLLRELGRPAVLDALLADLAGDERRLAVVAARSHHHALGFDKFILADFGHLGQLRMHVWWAGQDRRREHVHNHRFDFSSAVVVGQLDCYYYRTSEDGQPLTHLREHSCLGESAWRFDVVGVVGVIETLVVHLAPGSLYSMSADLFHRVDASSAVTVTLMLQGRLLRDWSSVLVAGGEQVPERLTRRCFDVEQVRDKIDTLRHCLASRAGAG